MLALGGVDSTISLLLRPPGGAFSAGCQLRGHQDWVRSLAFAHVAPEDGQSAGVNNSLISLEALQISLHLGAFPVVAHAALGRRFIRRGAL